MIVKTSSPSTRRHVFCQKILNGIRAHLTAVNGREKSIAISNRWFVQPGLERNIEHSGYWRSAFLASLPETPDMRPRVDGDRTSIKAHEFRDSHLSARLLASKHGRLAVRLSHSDFGPHSSTQRTFLGSTRTAAKRPTAVLTALRPHNGHRASGRCCCKAVQ